VDVYSDYDFTSRHGGTHFTVGLNHMDGEEALGFSRERYSFAAGDRVRGQNQQRVIEALIDKMMEPSNLLNFSSILNSLSQAVQTNMPENQMSALVKNQLSDMKGWDVQTASVDGRGDSQPTYSMGSLKLYVMQPDQATLDAAKSKIEAVIAGQ
jgi:anionic cell wall polymer biosynthesis LytR-Cps2A-Psr (LCP) family protein